MDNKYLKNIITQYQNALNNIEFNISCSAYRDELAMFISKRQQLLYKYIMALRQLGVLDNPGKVAEVGKGLFDTIAIEDKNVSLITPYNDDLKKNVTNHIYKFDIERNFNFEEIDLKVGKVFLNKERFITHNPYCDVDIRVYSKLHNNGKLITFGMFGYNDDKDKLLKLKQLIDLRMGINDRNIDVNSFNDSDSYMLILTSKK